MARKPISAKLRYLILERDGFACQCCGGKAPNVTLHVDHIIAVANGGSDDPENLRAVCITCNVGKSDMDTTVVPLPGAKNYPIRISDNEVKINYAVGEDLSQPIFWVGVQWAVTSHGIECRDGTYAIEAKNLWQDEPGYNWIRHMSDKDWVNMRDFRSAFDFAKDHFKQLKPKHLKSA
jgi:hypothetical protein